MLPMFHAWKPRARSCSIALQWISHAHARDVGQLLEPRAKQLIGRLRILTALHQEIEDVRILIHGSSEIVTITLDWGIKRFS